MTNEELIQLAKAQYKEDGPNQWPHIQRVLAQANQLAEYRQRKLNQLETAAVLLHDIGKGKEIPEDKNHGYASARILRKLLENKLKERQISIIANAVADHDNQATKPVSKISELLRSSDANRPELGFFLRKSLNKMQPKLGYEGAIENAYEHAHTGTPYAGGDRQYPLDLYRSAFAKEIAKEKKQIKQLKKEDIQPIIDAYMEAHPEEGLYL